MMFAESVCAQSNFTRSHQLPYGCLQVGTLGKSSWKYSLADSAVDYAIGPAYPFFVPGRLLLLPGRLLLLTPK
jgi:hypothetical protein